MSAPHRNLFAVVSLYKFNSPRLCVSIKQKRTGLDCWSSAALVTMHTVMYHVSFYYRTTRLVNFHVYLYNLYVRSGLRKNTPSGHCPKLY